MDAVRRLLTLLDQNQVFYRHSTHPIAYTALEVATAEHLPGHMVAKTVVFVSEKGYAMAVLPADMWVNLDELRQAVGAQRLELATEREIGELFGDTCELGAMAPFGNGTLYELPIYVDSSLAVEDLIAVNAGTHRDVVQLRYSDFARLVKPAVIHFARSAAA